MALLRWRVRLASSKWSYHDGGEVFALKATDGVVQRLVHRCRNPLGDQAVQVNGATKKLRHTRGIACKCNNYGAKFGLRNDVKFTIAMFQL